VWQGLILAPIMFSYDRRSKNDIPVFLVSDERNWAAILEPLSYGTCSMMGGLLTRVDTTLLNKQPSAQLSHLELCQVWSLDNPSEDGRDLRVHVPMVLFPKNQVSFNCATHIAEPISKTCCQGSNRRSEPFHSISISNNNTQPLA
jgi:hypothetical protein